MTATTPRASRAGIVAAIIRKDFTAFTRDWFFVVISIIGLVFFALIFWLLPNTVDETITIGVTGPGIGEFLEQSTTGSDGIAVKLYSSEDALTTAVEKGDDGVAVGLAFPPDFVESMAARQPTTVSVLVTAEVPGELRDAMDSLVREIAYALAGDTLPVTELSQNEYVLGTDRSGDQVSLREKMRPLLAFFVLVIEMMTLAALIAAEIQQRTVTAIVTTPARVSDFLTAKVIAGTLLAFVQAVILLIAIRSLGANAPLMVTIVLLGALMVTAFALIAGSYGRDFISVVFWSMLFLIPLMIPAFAVLFPGTASSWVKAIPSYGLINAIVGTTSYGDGWAEALPNLAMVAAWTVVAYVIGLSILKRKVEAL
jgi:ABC-2 type transport system permease protein